MGVWSAGTAGVVIASGVPEHAKGVGCRVVWDTAGITGTRRVRGSTYLVPLCVNQYDPSGTILDAAWLAFATAADVFRTAVGDLVVLTKKTDEHSGTSHPVTGVRVPDRVSWLTSRRT